MAGKMDPQEGLFVKGVLNSASVAVLLEALLHEDLHCRKMTAIRRKVDFDVCDGLAKIMIPSKREARCPEIRSSVTGLGRLKR